MMAVKLAKFFSRRIAYTVVSRANAHSRVSAHIPNFKGSLLQLPYKHMEFISQVSAHAGRNRELYLSAHGRLPGTLRYIHIVWSKLKGITDFYLIVFFCTSKVNKLDHSPTGDHDVGPLDVSMDDGIGVEVIKSSGDLTSVVGYCTAVQRTKSEWKVCMVIYL